jgi:dTDP-4-amino-4,6-dideoxygalactose transaminase
MRNHGAKPKYYHRFVGGNFRLDAIQAAILLVKLRYLDQWSQSRRENALEYDRAFHGTCAHAPSIRPYSVSVFNQYVIRVDRRDELIGHLKQHGIASEIYYPQPLHLQECFSSLGYSEGDCPESELAARQVLALPIYPELPPAEQAFVAETVLNFV